MTDDGQGVLAGFLNPQQMDAVVHGEGPQLVLAGAGSGKTRVITYRVAWLVHERGVDPASIVAVTFTNKAAQEMRGRIEELLGLHPLPTFVGTFHRFCLALLRRHGARIGVGPGFVIFDADDQLALMRVVLKEEQLDEARFTPRAMLASISAAKNRLLGPEAFELTARDFYSQRVARVYRRYQERLERAAGVDFDDMLRHAVTLLDLPEVGDRVRRRIHHLLVDEFQDTNYCQLRLVQGLLGPARNLTAVGDEDQSIYRWRGAELDNILSFENAFPGAVVRKLERNYRSTKNILAAAGAVVAHNRRRRGKSLWTEAGQGEPIELYQAVDEGDEARWIVRVLEESRTAYGFEEMAVLVRTNAQTRALEEELLRRQVPYTLVAGVRFYERAEIKDLVAYLRVLRNPRDGLSMARILNQPPRGIGAATQDLLARTAAAGGISLWDFLEHGDLGSFSSRAASALLRFRDLVSALRKTADELPLPALLDHVLGATGYGDLYRRDDAESQARLENIREFLSAAQEFTEEQAFQGAEDVLGAFLDHVSLVSDLDAWDPAGGVSVMTLHSAKGLEFPLVVVAGLEDGLLPHFNTRGVAEDVEEERRLLYVGMTRARERLFLTTCSRRRVAGRYQDQVPSPFLDEIPKQALQVSHSPELFREERVQGAYEFFGRAPATVEGPSEPSPGTVRRGARVRHPRLGKGIVLDTEGQGEAMKLTVYFEGSGKRKLVAKYASLELL